MYTSTHPGNKMPPILVTNYGLSCVTFLAHSSKNGQVNAKHPMTKYSKNAWGFVRHNTKRYPATYSSIFGFNASVKIFWQAGKLSEPEYVDVFENVAKGDSHWRFIVFFEITWGFGVLYWISRFYVTLRNALCVDAVLEPTSCNYHVAGKK